MYLISIDHHDLGSPPTLMRENLPQPFPASPRYPPFLPITSKPSPSCPGWRYICSQKYLLFQMRFDTSLHRWVFYRGWVLGINKSLRQCRKTCMFEIPAWCMFKIAFRWNPHLPPACKNAKIYLDWSFEFEKGMCLFGVHVRNNIDQNEICNKREI